VYNVTVNTRSYGAGYHYALDEFWFPQWPSSTIYRTDRQGNLVSSFTAAGGQGNITQLFVDVTGTGYYTANSQQGTITKLGPFPRSIVQWTYNLGVAVGGVSADYNNVYAMAVTGNTVYVLDRTNGALVRNITLTGSNDTFTSLSSGFLVALDKIYRGDSSSKRTVYRYDLATGLFDGTSFVVADVINALTFDGRDMCISGSFSALYCYRILASDIYYSTNTTGQALFTNSRLLSTEQNINLTQAIGTLAGNTMWGLCFSTYANTSSGATFHSACNNLGSTVVVAQVAQNSRIIGGYASVSWTSRGGYLTDRNEYLFTFNPTYQNVSNANTGTYAMYDIPSACPTFGGGYDCKCHLFVLTLLLSIRFASFFSVVLFSDTLFVVLDNHNASTFCCCTCFRVHWI
jgi:hypothetical protein